MRLDLPPPEAVGLLLVATTRPPGDEDADDIDGDRRVVPAARSAGCCAVGNGDEVAENDGDELVLELALGEKADDEAVDDEDENDE